jgi:Ca2+-transporting ATPase
MEKPEPDVMRRPPRPPNEPVITPRRAALMVWYGALMAAVAALGFGVDYFYASGDLSRSRTIGFCVLAFSQLFFAIGCRSQRYTMPHLGLVSNRHLFWAISISAVLQLIVVTLPPLQRVFRTNDTSLGEWLLFVPLALVPVTAIEAAKLVRLSVRQRDPDARLA